MTQDEYGAVEALYQAAGYNAQNAAMPLLGAKNQGGLRIIHRHPLALIEDCFHDIRFGLLPVGIELMQLIRESAGAIVIGSEKKFDDVVGRGHASGGVHAWSDAECYLRGGGHAVTRESGNIQQGAQA